MMLYADEQVLLAELEEELQILAHQINTTANKCKIKLSTIKTRSKKIMMMIILHITGYSLKC
jgi:hypothetical protein